MLIRTLLLLTLLASLAASGCIFSPPKDGPGDPPPPIKTCAETPDDLMTIWREIYSSRNIDDYRKILSEDFLFVPPSEEGDSYGYDEEIRIHYNMFTGLAGVDGIVISNITVDQLDNLGVWQPTPAGDPNFGGFPGSQFRDYEVDINFYVSGQDLRLRVQGIVRYYVKSETVDGETCFKYLGMEDYTFGG